jgi:hypothetical protein
MRSDMHPRRATQESGSGISRFQTRTQVTTIDAHPIPQSGGLMAYVTGNVIVRSPSSRHCTGWGGG